MIEGLRTRGMKAANSSAAAAAAAAAAYLRAAHNVYEENEQQHVQALAAGLRKTNKTIFNYLLIINY